MRANFFLSLVVTAGALTLINATWAERLPDTPKKPVDTEYQGVTVEDPYQWLEADEDSQVKAWSDAENQQTRKYLDSFPDRAAIEKQLQDWYAKTSPSYFSLVSRPGILFMMKFQPLTTCGWPWTLCGSWSPLLNCTGCPTIAAPTCG